MDSSIYTSCEHLNYFEPPLTRFHLRGAVQIDPHGKEGEVLQRRIWVDGIEVIPEIGCSLRPFYGANFEWGWNASLSAFNTALSVCCFIFKNQRIAENLFVPFKEDFIDRLPDHDFELDVDLSEFLHLYHDRLHPFLYSRFCKAALINAREILVYKDPETGEISANLAENYAMHNRSDSNRELKRLNERKQRLIFRLFAKEDYLITGYSFERVMEKAEEVMDRFYSKSFERLLKKKR